jgi:hypothetical protein
MDRLALLARRARRARPDAIGQPPPTPTVQVTVNVHAAEPRRHGSVAPGRIGEYLSGSSRYLHGDSRRKRQIAPYPG